MSDIPLIKTLVTIEPISVANTAQNTSQAPNPLSTLSNGTLVDGFVVKRDSNNQPILRTPAGDVLLNTPLFLKTGTEVSLRVDHNQPHLARILTINGQSPEIFSEQQRVQLTAHTNDSLSSQLASAVGSNAAIPKPVFLQGVILQLAARETLPAAVADALFKALGITKTTRNNAPMLPNAPLSMVLRSISMPPAEDKLSQSPLLTQSGPSQLQTQPKTVSTPPIPTPVASGIIAKDIPVQSAIQPAANAPTAPMPEGVKPTVISAPAPQAAINSPTQLPTLTADKVPAQTTTAPLPTPQTALPKGISPQPQAAPNANTSPPATIAADAPDIVRSAPGNVAVATTPSASPSRPQTVPVLQSLPQATESQHVTSSSATPRSLAPIQINPNNSFTVQGLVIGQEQQADTIVHTPMGSMRIFTPKPLPSGAIVTLDVSAYTPTNSSIPTTPSHMAMQIEQEATKDLMRDWPGLSELVEDTVRNDALLFQSALAKAIPTPGKHFTQSMLFFLSALKGGDMKQWLGTRNIDMLEAKYGDVIRRLGAEFSTLQQVFNEPSPQNWLSTTIPILYENTLHQARLHIREDAEQQNKQQQGGQRFVIDIELSRLGEMQIDGFVQKEAAKHQFDMIIRTSKALPSDVERDIKSIYANASELTGFKGTLIFQPTREHFVIITPKSTPKRDNGIIA